MQIHGAEQSICCSQTMPDSCFENGGENAGKCFFVPLSSASPTKASAVQSSWLCSTKGMISGAPEPRRNTWDLYMEVFRERISVQGKTLSVKELEKSLPVCPGIRRERIKILSVLPFPQRKVGKHHCQGQWVQHEPCRLWFLMIFSPHFFFQHGSISCLAHLENSILFFSGFLLKNGSNFQQ